MTDNVRSERPFRYEGPIEADCQAHKEHQKRRNRCHRNEPTSFRHEARANAEPNDEEDQEGEWDNDANSQSMHGCNPRDGRFTSSVATVYHTAASRQFGPPVSPSNPRPLARQRVGPDDGPHVG